MLNENNYQLFSKGSINNKQNVMFNFYYLIAYWLFSSIIEKAILTMLSSTFVE